MPRTISIGKAGYISRMVIRGDGEWVKHEDVKKGSFKKAWEYVLNHGSLTTDSKDYLTINMQMFQSALKVGGFIK